MKPAFPVFVTLVFDDDSTTKLEHLRYSVLGGTVGSEVDIPSYRPHITLTGTTHENAYMLKHRIEHQMTALFHTTIATQFHVRLVKFGLYPNPSVFSLIPDPIAGQLRWLQHEIGKGILPLNASFEPENWKPHITLVKALQNKEQRNAAVRAIAPDWEPFSVRAVGIGIKERGKHVDTHIIPFGV